MSTTSQTFVEALGDGWLGKILLAAGGIFGGWIIRRPTEQAAASALLDKRFNEFIALQDTQISTLRQQIIEDRQLCDAQLKELRKRISHLQSSTDALELRAWPIWPDKDGLIGGEGMK